MTIVVTFLFSTYLLFDPGTWPADLMEITEMALDFKIFILLLAIAGFASGWIAERYVFLWIARLLGRTQDVLWPQHRKIRKEYKTLLEDMKI